jgi:protein-tyrosine-phosphatase
MRPQPPEDGSNAIEALAAAYSIDASSHVPRDVRDIELDSFDVIVAMDRGIARELKGLSAREPVVWEIHDPWGNDPTEYRSTAIIIGQKVKKLLRSLGIEVRDAA